MVGDPNDNPAFLDPERAEAASYVGAPPDEPPTFDDELLAGLEPNPEAPSRGIINRYKEIARLHAHGMTNNRICALLQYTPSRLSIILKDPFVQSEIKMWRDLMIDNDTLDVIKQAARDGARRIHSIILDPRAKESSVLQASQFAIEKSHGKAKQEVSVESGTLTAFMELMRDMQKRGETLDVTPISAPELPATQAPHSEADHWTAWAEAELSHG